MIKVHRLNGKEFFVNCELIKYVEATPDTIVTLIDNEKFMVRETIEQILEATLKYKKDVHFFPAKTETTWKSPQS